MNLCVCPITFRKAAEFVGQFHRHNKPPRGCKFCVGINDTSGKLRGVAMCGRPVARHFDDGLTLEINRTCTDGSKNANSKLYGACRAIARAMGYRRIVTYTQAQESGASLHASGFVRVRDIPARGSWANSTQNEQLRKMRDAIGTGGVDRVLWEVRFEGAS